MLSASSKARGRVLAVSSGFVNEVLVRFGFFKVFRCDAFGQYVNPGQVRQMPSHRTDTRHRRCIQQVHARQLCRLSKLETLTSNGSNVRARLIQTSSLQAQCVPIVTVVYKRIKWTSSCFMYKRVYKLSVSVVTDQMDKQLLYVSRLLSQSRLELGNDTERSSLLLVQGEHAQVGVCTISSVRSLRQRFSFDDPGCKGCSFDGKSFSANRVSAMGFEPMRTCVQWILSPPP